MGNFKRSQTDEGISIISLRNIAGTWQGLQCCSTASALDLWWSQADAVVPVKLSESFLMHLLWEGNVLPTRIMHHWIHHQHSLSGEVIRRTTFVSFMVILLDLRVSLHINSHYLLADYLDASKLPANLVLTLYSHQLLMRNGAATSNH